MKKKLLTLALLFSLTILTFAQDTTGTGDKQGGTNTGWSFSKIDITSVLISLVVGGGIGYFLGSKKNSN